MKISLSIENNIRIISVSGPIDAHNYLVLKAGITKLMKNGQNKIILELLDTKEIIPQIYQEIANLNQLARDLSGEILLAGLDADLQRRLNQLSKPPALSCFKSRKIALLFFEQQKLKAMAQEKLKTAEEKYVKTKGVLPSVQSAALAELLKKKDAEIEELRSLSKVKPEEILPMQREIAKLRSDNLLINRHFEVSLPRSRNPVTSEEFQEKVKILENEILELTNRLRQVESKANTQAT